MIYLYHFSFYSKPRDGVLLDTWTHTNFEDAVVNNAYNAANDPNGPGFVFEPLRGLSHADITYDSEKGAGQIAVTVPRDFEVADKFRGGYPYGTVYLRVAEVDGPGADEPAQVIWTGRVRSCDFGELTAKLQGTDGREMLMRLGLRINGGTQCQWPLYSAKCGVEKAAHTRAGVVTSVSADGLTVGTTLTEVAGYFTAGLIEANGQARQINASTAGGQLTLMSAISGLVVGQPVSASRGCNKTGAACKGFGNYTRFSGFESFTTPKNVFAKGVL